jgi:hypothetical protein
LVAKFSALSWKSATWENMVWRYICKNCYRNWTITNKQTPHSSSSSTIDYLIPSVNRSLRFLRSISSLLPNTTSNASVRTAKTVCMTNIIWISCHPFHDRCWNNWQLQHWNRTLYIR